MKNKKIALIASFVLLTSGFSFSANAGSGNGHENIEKTKSYQNFIKNKKVYNNVNFDNNVFVNHDSNS